MEPAANHNGLSLAETIDREIAALVARYYELKYAGGVSPAVELAGVEQTRPSVRQGRGGGVREEAALLAEGRVQLRRIESYLPRRSVPVAAKR
jgi:hypothetical protein